MTDPFGSTSDAVIEKADVAVESLIPGLEPPVPQRLPSQTESVTSNRTDSLTGEDSLLDCSLLSNPTTDLLEEFAPTAISAPVHKGKCFLLLRPACVLRGERTKQLLRVFLIKSLY
uniref:Uncharacterized protein n=1 Tax=Macaca fascicularis TaxID=9541 RepID=Q2PFY1_MACFA|nr:hypothetical protein [Macaca fascicularis]